MRLFLIFSGCAFIYLWGMITDDHLPEIQSTLLTEAASDGFFCGNVPPSLTEEHSLGATLFKSHCNACHNRNMVDDLTGPALRGVTERWAEYPKEDLYNWIRNSQKMVQEEHPRAVKIYKEWFPTYMNSFNFTDEEIEALLIYIEQ